ncbi:MAG: hypothetical protein ABJC61_08925, partial [Acidobacteriota bacterium]
MLIQAAGTVLLFLLFLLLYKKIRRRAFLDWIASWAFLLCGLGLELAIPMVAETRSFVFLLHIALLAHVLFLLRGVRRFRDERAGTGAYELLWIVPIVAIAWWTAMQSPLANSHSAAIALVLAAGYVTSAVSFA